MAVLSKSNYMTQAVRNVPSSGTSSTEEYKGMTESVVTWYGTSRPRQQTPSEPVVSYSCTSSSECLGFNSS